jgi:hypothetical protein
VLLYEAASRPPHRRSLEAVRRGGLGGLARPARRAGVAADYGPRRCIRPPVRWPSARAGRSSRGTWSSIGRPAAGAPDRRDIRTSSGGLPCLKALGLPLEHTGQVQVSMNLTDYRTTSMAEVFRAVDGAVRSRWRDDCRQRAHRPRAAGRPRAISPASRPAFADAAPRRRRSRYRLDAAGLFGYSHAANSQLPPNPTPAPGSGRPPVAAVRL